MLTRHWRCTLPAPDSTSHSGLAGLMNFSLNVSTQIVLIFLIVIHIDRIFVHLDLFFISCTCVDILKDALSWLTLNEVLRVEMM